MTVRRFFFTTSKKSRVLHRCYSDRHVEGERTVCGKAIAAGWIWMQRQKSRMRICHRCEAGL